MNMGQNMLRARERLAPHNRNRKQTYLACTDSLENDPAVLGRMVIFELRQVPYLTQHNPTCGDFLVAV